MTASFTQHRMGADVTFSNVVPTVSGSTSVPATSLPDPSTFFDSIGPEPQIVPAKSGIASPNILTEAMDGLSVKVHTFHHNVPYVVNLVQNPLFPKIQSKYKLHTLHFLQH